MPYFGRNIRTVVFGQSHAAAIGVTIDGLPAGEAVDAVELEAFMARRAPEQNRMTTQRREADRPEREPIFRAPCPSHHHKPTVEDAVQQIIGEKS